MLWLNIWCWKICWKHSLDNKFRTAPCFSVEHLVCSSAYCLHVAGDNLGFTLPQVILGAFETKMRELKTLTSTLIIPDITKTKSKCLSFLWRYIICNSHEDTICNSGECFSDKRQSTPNVSNDFQCHLMIWWNLLESSLKSVCKYAKSIKTNIGKSQGPLLFCKEVLSMAKIGTSSLLLESLRL